MTPPTLVLGRASGDNAILYRYGFDESDDDQPVLLQLRTAEVALAGIGGRVSFKRLFTAITFTQPFRLRFTPIVDGKIPAGEYADVEVTQAAYDIPANDLVAGERRTHLFEIALSLGRVRDATERFRYAMQGCYFQVEIQQMDPLAELGELILENLELEYRVLSRGAVQ